MNARPAANHIDYIIQYVNKTECDDITTATSNDITSQNQSAMPCSHKASGNEATDSARGKQGHSQTTINISHVFLYLSEKLTVQFFLKIPL